MNENTLINIINVSHKTQVSLSTKTSVLEGILFM